MRLFFINRKHKKLNPMHMENTSILISRFALLTPAHLFRVIWNFFPNERRVIENVSLNINKCPVKRGGGVIFRTSKYKLPFNGKFGPVKTRKFSENRISRSKWRATFAVKPQSLISTFGKGLMNVTLVDFIPCACKGAYRQDLSDF